MQLEFTHQSVLKRSPAQSSKLKPDEKVTVGEGERVNISRWAEADDGHIKVTAQNPINGIFDWFAFSGHLRLLDDAGELLVDDNPDPETAPQSTDAKEPPDDAPKAEPGRPKKMIQLPGKRKVNLYDPICPESPNFFWYEATHGGTRIPTTTDQVDAIIRIAKALQRLRGVIPKPFRITSWFRPEPFNSKAGGAKRSQHLYGGAVDVVIEGLTGRDIGTKALTVKMADGKLAFGGIGLYPGNRKHICHLDVRGYRSRWGF